MSVDRWFIGGGAVHTPESARRLAYAATSGAEGVAGASDLKVLPLSVPGQGVRVLMGTAAILSHYLGGETQTYMGTVYEGETLATTPSGSAGPRSDLIVFRVRDPWAAGSTDTLKPGETADTAQYLWLEVVSGVPAGTTRLQSVPGYQDASAITLARIDFPASTGTVQAGMITDLRRVALAREQTIVRGFGLVSGDGSQQLTDPTATTWPSAAAAANKTMIPIPVWATQAAIVEMTSGAKVPGGGQATGETWVQIGENGDANRVLTQSTWWDVDETSGPHRVVVVNSDTVTIPASMRGTSQRFYPRGRKSGGADAKSLIADQGTSVSLQITFREVPI